MHDGDKLRSSSPAICDCGAPGFVAARAMAQWLSLPPTRNLVYESGVRCFRYDHLASVARVVHYHPQIGCATASALLRTPHQASLVILAGSNTVPPPSETHLPPFKIEPSAINRGGSGSAARCGLQAVTVRPCRKAECQCIALQWMGG